MSESEFRGWKDLYDWGWDKVDNCDCNKKQEYSVYVKDAQMQRNIFMKIRTIISIFSLITGMLLSVESFGQDFKTREQARADSIRQIDQKLQNQDKSKDQYKMDNAKDASNDTKAKSNEAKRVEKDATNASNQSKKALKQEKRAQRTRSKADQQAKKASDARDKSYNNNLLIGICTKSLQPLLKICNLQFLTSDLRSVLHPGML